MLLSAECCLDGAARLQQQGVQPPVAELCLEHEGALDLAHVHLLPPVHVQDGACDQWVIVDISIFSAFFLIFKNHLYVP